MASRHAMRSAFWKLIADGVGPRAFGQGECVCHSENVSAIVRSARTKAL